MRMRKPLYNPFKVLEITIVDVKIDDLDDLLYSLQIVRSNLDRHIGTTHSRFFVPVSKADGPSQVYIFAIWPSLETHGIFSANPISQRIIGPRYATTYCSVTTKLVSLYGLDLRVVVENLWRCKTVEVGIFTWSRGKNRAARDVMLNEIEKLRSFQNGTAAVLIEGFGLFPADGAGRQRLPPVPAEAEYVVIRCFTANVPSFLPEEMQMGVSERGEITDEYRESFDNITIRVLHNLEKLPALSSPPSLPEISISSAREASVSSETAPSKSMVLANDALSQSQSNSPSVSL